MDMKLRDELNKLKKLEGHLKFSTDVAIAAGLAYAASKDLANTVMYEGLYGLAAQLPHLYTRLEQTPLPKYLLSQFGLPGLGIATAADALIYGGFVYGAYKATNKFLEREGKWSSNPKLKRVEDLLIPKLRNLQNNLNEVPFVERLPGYGILLIGTCMRLQAANSWSVVSRI